MSQQKMSRAQLSLGLHRGWQTSLEMRFPNKAGRRERDPGREGHVCRQPRVKCGGGGDSGKRKLLVVNNQEVRDLGLGPSPDIQAER